MTKEYRLTAEITDGKLVIEKQDGSDFEVVATPVENGAKFPAVGFGAIGAVTTVLQALLRYYGHSIAIDGIFGADTRAAVVDFQTVCNIPADGYVSSETWSKLFGGLTYDN